MKNFSEINRALAAKKKIYLFIAAALCCVATAWAEEDAFSNFSFDEETAQLSFHDSFYEGHSFAARLYIVSFTAENWNISFGSKGVRVEKNIVNGNGGDIVIDIRTALNQVIDSCYTRGYTNLKIAVDGFYYDEIGWAQSYRDSYVNYNRKIDYEYQLPNFKTYLLAGKHVYYYEEDAPETVSISAHLQGVNAVTYTWQESTDNGNTWNSAANYATNGLDASPDFGSYLTTLEAREGQYIDFKCRFNKLGKQKTLYRLYVKDIKTDEEFVTDVYDVSFAYPWQINDGIKFWAEKGEKLSVQKPQDCHTYSYHSEQPVNVKEASEASAYLSITMPGCPLVIEEVTATYTVKFLDADYTLLDKQEVECGADAVAPADPSYGGYTFIGWSKDLTNVHSNMSVMAKYDIGNEYILNTFITDHKNEVFPFEGFANSETRAMVGDKMTFTADIFATSNATLYYETAQWLVADSAFNWQPNGGIKVADYTTPNQGQWYSQEISICYDENTSYIHAFEYKVGVRFYLLIAGVKVYSEPYEIDVYYPLTINSNIGDAVFAENNAGDYIQDLTAVLPARYNDTVRVISINGAEGACLTFARQDQPTRDLFSGEDENGDAYFICPGEKETINVSSVQYTVTFTVPGQPNIGYGNGVISKQTVACGQAAEVPADPEEAGYLFKGWRSDDPSSYPDDAYLSIPPTADRDFPVNFTAEMEELPDVPQYTVKFFGKDSLAQIGDDQLVNEGENAVPPTAPEVSGYHFVGWNKPYTTITANTEIVALYGADATTWTVTYKNWDNSPLGTEEVNDGESAQGLVATREGYSFIGWSEDISHVTSDMTVTAQFEKATYVITYTIDGEAIFSEEVEHGEMPTQYAAVEAQGKPSTEQYTYTFDHWNPAIEAATADATYEAVFTQALRKYNVRFQNWDHQLLKEQPVAYGTAAEAPANPTREGYTFKGWDRDFSDVRADLTVTAVFEKGNGEQGIEDIIAPADKAAKVLIDGALYIATPEGRIFNAQGIEVR